MICVSKEYKIKTKMVQEQWLQLKMMFLFFWSWTDFWWEGIKIWWGVGEWANFCWWDEDFPISLVGKILYKLCQQVFIYNEKCAHHIHRVPKWPSYFRKIWALCVLQIYMVYIFICLFSACNTINLSHHEHV